MFRPNALIATNIMYTVLDKNHVKAYIERVENELIGPNSLGIKTLAPSEHIYRPYFDEEAWGTDFFTQGGANHHNGPEWV